MRRRHRRRNFTSNEATTCGRFPWCHGPSFIPLLKRQTSPSFLCSFLPLFRPSFVPSLMAFLPSLLDTLPCCPSFPPLSFPSLPSFLAIPLPPVAQAPAPASHPERPTIRLRVTRSHGPCRPPSPRPRQIPVLLFTAAPRMPCRRRRLKKRAVPTRMRSLRGRLFQTRPPRDKPKPNGAASSGTHLNLIPAGIRSAGLQCRLKIGSSEMQNGRECKHRKRANMGCGREQV